MGLPPRHWALALGLSQGVSVSLAQTFVIESSSSSGPRTGFSRGFGGFSGGGGGFGGGPSSLISSVLSSLFQDDDQVDFAPPPTPPPPSLKLFFSDDGAAVLLPARAPPPPPHAFFSHFFSQEGPSLLRGAAPPGWELVAADDNTDDDAAGDPPHPCMHMADDAAEAEAACAQDTALLCGPDLGAADEVGAAFAQQLCLMRHSADLSPRCAAFLLAQDDSLVSMCHTDIDAQCADVAPGDHRVHNCLWQARPILTSGCRAQLQKSRPHVPDAHAAAAPAPLRRPASPKGRGGSAGSGSSLGSELGGMFAVLQELLGADDDASKAKNQAEQPMMGSDPATWAPKKNQGEQPMMGSDPATWAPKKNQAKQPMMGSDPATWAPKKNQGEQPMMGSDPATRAPEKNQAEHAPDPAASAPSAPFLLGKAAGDAWQFRARQSKPAVARPRGGGVRPMALTGRRDALTAEPTSNDGVHWGGGSGSDVPTARVEIPTARVEMAQAANGQAGTAAPVAVLGTGQGLPGGAPAPAWARTALAAGVAAAGGVAVLALAAVAHQAARRRRQRAAHAEWRRSFAPALLA